MLRISLNLGVIILLVIQLGCATKHSCINNTKTFASQVCGNSGPIVCVRAPCPKYFLTTFANSDEACKESVSFKKGACKTEGAKYGIIDKWASGAKDGT